MSSTLTLNLVEQTFVNKDGETIPADALSSTHIICYYVGAKWCPSSKKFREELETFYNTVNQPKKRLEIIYIGLDASETDFKEQSASFPWLSAPFNTANVRRFLNENSITVIPSVLLIKKDDGSILKKDCRGDIHFKGAAAVDEWTGLLQEPLLRDNKTPGLGESMLSKNLNTSRLSKK